MKFQVCDFRLPAVKWMRTAVFWVSTQQAVIIPYRCFGTAYRSHLERSRIQEEGMIDLSKWDQ
jgi:hypothetical protein